MLAMASELDVLTKLFCRELAEDSGRQPMQWRSILMIRARCRIRSPKLLGAIVAHAEKAGWLIAKGGRIVALTVSEVQDDLRRRGILSKRWTSSNGRTRGGVKFNRGSLYWLLRNPVYIGQVTHKGQVYEGRQQAIVDRALWERTQERLTAKSAAREHRPIVPGGRPLAGRPAV